MNKCIYCGRAVENKIVTFVYEEEGRRLFVEHVPAEVCTICGERTFSPEVTDDLLAFAKNKFKPVKTVAVPVFDFTEAE